MGGDNLKSISKWKNYEIILRDYKTYVYQRPGYDAGPFGDHDHVQIFNAPQMNISASYIRNCIQSGYSIEYLVPQKWRNISMKTIFLRNNPILVGPNHCFFMVICFPLALSK